MYRKTVILIALILILACAKRCPYPPPKIALLPFDNETNDIEASDRVRKRIFTTMSRRKYNLVDMKKIDAFLESQGIVDGGQLPALSLEALRKGIDADYFMYGLLNDYGTISLLVWAKMMVRVTVSIRNACNPDENIEEVGFAQKKIIGPGAILPTILGVQEDIAQNAVDELLRRLPSKLRKNQCELASPCK